jgi:hypothetical protein
MISKHNNMNRMKIRLTLSVILFFIITACYSQIPDKWEKWQWLIGNWAGEGSGQPGQGGGTFSFAFNLDKNILIRNSNSEYSSGDKGQSIIHDDLMIIYPGAEDNQSKAIYFDNEGHVIEYVVTFSDSIIIFSSDKKPDTPAFRLSYSPAGNDLVSTRFEMSQDGVKYFTYIEGKSKKIR